MPTMGRAWMLPMVLCCAIAAGCHSVPAPVEPPNHGNVGRTLLEPGRDEPRLALAQRQRFLYPLLMPEAPVPVYPDDLLPLRLAPVSTCVHVDIGDDGRVTAVSERVDAACAADASPHRERFMAVVLETVREWRYDPALLCTAPDVDAGDDPCAADGRDEQPVAVRLVYAFTFSQRDGAPLVEHSR